MRTSSVVRSTIPIVHFSHRVDTSEPNRIIQTEDAYRAQHIDIATVNDSNPTHHGLAPAALPSRYTADPRGSYEARLALSHYLHVDHPEQLYVLDSTSQAYSWLIKLLCDADDSILIPTPGYPLIASLARLECVNVHYYDLYYDGSWMINIAAIEQALRDDVDHHIRAIVVINPNNPTGSYVKASERARILALCRTYDIAIIADEVFFDYALEPFDGNRRFLGESEVLTFALDGFSKTLAAPHAKVGWIYVSGPQEQVAAAQLRLDRIADDFLPMSAFVAQQIPALLEEAPHQLSRVRERVTTNLRTLHTMLAADELGVVDVLRAEGGWNVLLHFPSVIDENELMVHMIHTYHLSGQPGYFFDMTSNGYMAVSLLPEPQQFSQYMHHILAAVADQL